MTERTPQESQRIVDELEEKVLGETHDQRRADQQDDDAVREIDSDEQKNSEPPV